MAAVTPVTPVTPSAAAQPLGEDIDEFENIGNDRSDSYISTLKTAMNHFDGFLAMESRFSKNKENPIPEKYADLKPKHITDELLGKFSCYLISAKTKIKKCDSVLANLSKVKVELQRRFSEDNIACFAVGAQGYTLLRANITRRFLLQCAKNGTKMTDHSVPMQESDLLWMVRKLLSKSTWEGINNRCLLVLQWQVLGRIIEIAALLFKNIHVVDPSRPCKGALSFDITRIKTGVQQDVLVFLHAKHWELCPLHALACLVLGSGSSEAVFEDIGTGCEATYTNRLAKLLIV